MRWEYDSTLELQQRVLGRDDQSGGVNQGRPTALETKGGKSFKEKNVNHSNLTKKWSSSVSLEFCYKWPWKKPFWSRGFQRAGESMQIGRRLARQDTERLVLLWAFHSGSGWGGMWRGDSEFLAKKLGKSRAEQDFCLEDQKFLLGVSERSIVHPHLWHVLNSICGQALSYAGSPSESKCLGSPSWIEGCAEGWPCTVSTRLRMMQATVCRKRSALYFLWGLFQL